MNVEQILMITELTPEGLLVGTEPGTGRVLCAIPAVRGPHYAIAAVPRGQRKAREVMVPRGVPWRVSPLGVMVVLQHEDTASRALTGFGIDPSAEEMQNAHPGLVAEYLTRLGDRPALEQLLLDFPCAIEWVHATREAQLFPVPDFGPMGRPLLGILREFVEVLPQRSAARNAAREALASLGLDSR